MTDASETRRFEKTATIVEKDDDERVATGAVLVPNEVDHQGDWLRPDAVDRFFNETPDAGVMHAAFHDSAELVRNEVVSEPIELGGEQYPAGTWVASRQYQDDDLWELVSDGVLNGFSIGGEITEHRAYAPDETPEDVRYPEGVPEGEETTELVDGRVSEISDVDIPAVPRAEYATAKSLHAEKNILEQAGSESEFLDLMAERGHSEDDARRLWRFLQDTMSDETGEKNLDDLDDATLIERLKERLLGSPDDGEDSPEVPDAEKLDAALETAKAGRTLNSQNRQALMAAHDAIESALSSDMEFEQNRFTDNSDVDFALADYGDDGSESGDSDSPAWTSKDEDSESMTDEDTDETDKSLAEQNAERLDGIEEKLDKALSDDDDTEKADDDEGDDLAEKVDALAETVDEIAKQGGGSQQLGKTDQTDDEDDLEAAKRQLFIPASER